MRASRIQSRADEGSSLARRLLPILEDTHLLDRYIAASQIGITLSSLVLGAYGQAALSPYVIPLLERFAGMQGGTARSTAAIAILVSLTVLAMILGELIPKSLALHSPARVALWTLLPMQWSLHVMSWFITVLNGSGTLILRVMGASLDGHRHVHSPEEIEYLVAESGKGGLFKPSESLRLRQALLLGRRPIQELMVPRTAIEAIDVDDSFAAVVQQMTDSSYTRLPVYRESIDNIIGIAHSRDVALAAWSAHPPASVEEIMRQALVLPASMMADRVLARLKEEKRTMAVLADEFGGTAGLVTVDNFLDDLIGDVTDEFRESSPTAELLADGRIRLPGSFHVSEMWPWTHARWTGAVTAGGVVLAAFGRAPVAGERIEIAGVEVEVESAHRNRIESILVRPLRPSPQKRERP